MTRSDKKVYRFLTYEKQVSFSKFETFLIAENLPIIEKWYYYWLGRHCPFDESDFLYPNENDETYFIYASENTLDIGQTKLQLWQEYLKDYEQQKSDIVDNLVLNQVEIDDSLIQSIFYQNGWKYVNYRTGELLEQYEENETEQFANDFFEQQEGKTSNWNNEDNFCEACQSTPCMCSDPTSRT